MMTLTRWLPIVLLLAVPAAVADRPATVLLITSRALAPAWQPWADWKTRQGKATTIVTVERIRTAYEGADIQQKIRACVLDQIQTHSTRWVVLGGDSRPDGQGVVPHRVTPHGIFRRMRARRFAGPDQIELGGHQLPTDLYYLSPEGKGWDANDDGVYGDWRSDRRAIAYTHPSGACLGRIPVRTAADVKAYTAKVIGYESRYPAGEFGRTFMYTNTVDGSEPKVRKSWDAHLSKVWSGGKVLRFFHSGTPWDGERRGSYALDAGNWRARINGKTASKLHMHGHGMPQFWVLEHPSTGHTKINPGLVDRLANKDAYLVLTTVACYTGQFDTAGDPCIAESMLRAEEKGAVVVVAPSRPGVPVFHDPRRDMRLMVQHGKMDGTTESLTRFWAAGLSRQKDGGFLTVGEAMARAKAEMASHAVRNPNYHMVQCELNLLGDPTLDLRAGTLVTPTVAAPTTLAVGVATVTVKTTPGLTVCLWKGDEVYAVGTAGKGGACTLEVDTKTPGTLLLTVCGANANTVSRDVVIR